MLVEVLDTPDAQTLAQVIARHGIATVVPPAALAEAERARKLPHTVNGRRDLREVPTVTIDAASTRDIDDAISVLPADEDGAVRLLVSIADVSAFVPAGGALDQDARAVVAHYRRFRTSVDLARLVPRPERQRALSQSPPGRAQRFFARFSSLKRRPPIPTVAGNGPVSAPSGTDTRKKPDAKPPVPPA